MKAEAEFMRTASLTELEARDWRRRDVEQQGAYKVMAFEGKGYDFPPDVSEPIQAGNQGMWCVTIGMNRFRNIGLVTLDINGEIIDRNIRRVVALGQD
jgi:hypothetical protein